MSTREPGHALTAFSEILMNRGPARARAAERAKSQAKSPPANHKAQEPDSCARAGASPFAHLLGRGHLLAARASTDPGAAPRPARTPEADAQARADFINRSAAMARGEIPIPLDAPQSRSERAARAQADFISASAAKARPSLYGDGK